MADEPKPDEKKPTEPEPVAPDATDIIIEKMNLATLRREEANKKSEELVRREEKLMVERKLGGKSEAGVAPEKPKEETDLEYSRRIMKG